MFQSTHPRGVRLVFVTTLLVSTVFQSTHPRGVRQEVLTKELYAGNVSIHAPAWGATTGKLKPIRSRVLFQSTHPRGVRRQTRRRVLHALQFQSTHPRGVRRANAAALNQANYVSIHAPAWGATPDCCRGRAPSDSFNPRTRVGCDVRAGRDGLVGKVFQSTHPRGVRQFPCFIQ